ncbi:MAG: FG-GAP-like repeat-containing protein [Gemmataceae bacterium]
MRTRSGVWIEKLEDRCVPAFFGNGLFPGDNPWNQKVTAAPVAANSTAIIQHIVNHSGGSGPSLHPDFGNPTTDGALYGIPINVVGAGQPTVSIVIPSFGYGSESDNPGAPIPIPIPANAVIEGDGPTGPASPVNRGDSHLIVYDKDANKLYELFLAARPTETTFPSYDTNPGPAHPTGQWGAYGEAVWDLTKNTFRQIGWTSADAAGLPILPGLVRPDEALPPAQNGQGIITHAIRMTVRDTLGDPNQVDYIYPASHVASNKIGSDLPRMGERFRLKASTVIPGTWSPEAKAIAQAMKDYGLIVADNGSDMFFTGQPAYQWNDNNLNPLKTLHAADFEVVDLTPIVTGLSVTSGPTAGGTPVSIMGQNFSGAAGNLHINFGTTAVTTFTIVSDTQINVLAPAHAAGTIDVQVTSGSTQTDAQTGQPVQFGYGKSAISAADQFTFSGSGGKPVKSLYATGADAGGGPQVRFFNADGSQRLSFFAYAANFTAGVRVAVGDVNGDGVPDVMTAPGPGGGPHVEVFDGVTGSLIRSFFAYSSSFTGGLYIAAGDVNGDGVADIITGAGSGGGPHVQVFDGKTGNVLKSFFAYGSTFTGGVHVAGGDVNGDGFDDIITAPGAGGGPQVRVRNGVSLADIYSFFAFDPSFTGGVYVAAGDLDGDGKADIIASQGQMITARLRTFRGSDGTQSGDFAPLADLAVPPDGLRVAVADINGDGRVDILAASARISTKVRGFKGTTLTQIRQFDAFDPSFLGGVFVG